MGADVPLNPWERALLEVLVEDLDAHPAVLPHARDASSRVGRGLGALVVNPRLLGLVVMLPVVLLAIGLALGMGGVLGVLASIAVLGAWLWSAPQFGEWTFRHRVVPLLRLHVASGGLPAPFGARAWVLGAIARLDARMDADDLARARAIVAAEDLQDGTGSRRDRVRFVAERYRAAFESFTTAPEDCYAPHVVSWRSVTDEEVLLQDRPSGARLRDVLPDLRHTGVTLEVGDDAFVLRYRTVATVPGHGRVEVPVCLIAELDEDGRICRFEEYADAATAAPLVAALVNG